jgi:DNA-binding transcriptional MerR regulator
MSLHFFELKKLPVNISADNKLLLWLYLFKANTKEELAKIKALEVPEMEQAINAYERITTTSEFMEKERLYSKARRNEAASLRHAQQKGEARGEARGKAMERQHFIELLNRGLSIEEIKKQLSN